jgi:hypothetical protein
MLSLDTNAEKRRVASRQYQRQYRQRQNRGEVVVGITVGRNIIEALLQRGMDEEASRDIKKVAAELSDVLEDWAAEWLKAKPPR